VCLDAQGNVITTPPESVSQQQCEAPVQNPFTYVAVNPGDDLCTINGVTTPVQNRPACEALAGTSPSTNVWTEVTDDFTADVEDIDESVWNGTPFLFGVQGGYNLQHDNIVYGVEASLSGLGRERFESSSHVQLIFNPGNPDNPVNDSFLDVSATSNAGLLWYGTLKGRIGFASDRPFLPFITGGLAFGEVSTEGHVDYLGEIGIGQATPIDTGADFGGRSMRLGWTLGVGVDYAVTDNVFLTFSAAHVHLGAASATHQFTQTEGPGNSPNTQTVSGSATTTVNANFNEFKVGMSVLFD
jgi:opacity protein-like surface antigen